MKCIYVALNQTSTPGVDSLMGTKHLRAEPELDFEHRSAATAASCSSSDDQVPFKPAAGQCRTSGMCTWRFKKEKKKCLNNQRREEGRGGEPELLILHPSPGSNRLKPSWQRHLVLWIPHKRADYGHRARGRAGLGQWNIFMTWYLIHKKNLKRDLIWIKVHFHVSLLLLFTLFHGVINATFCLQHRRKKTYNYKTQ